MVSKLSRVKKIVLELLSDGMEHTSDEMRSRINEEGIELDKKCSTLRTAIYQLRNNGTEIYSRDRGIYQIREKNTEESYSVIKGVTTLMPEEKIFSKYDFSSFIQVKSSSRKTPQEILGVLANGELTINAKLLGHFPEYKMDIRISPDCSEIVLFLRGKEMINVGKNGRTKNYDLQKKLEMKKKLPAYYIGEWDEEEKLWYGKYLPYNPNKGEKQLKK